MRMTIRLTNFGRHYERDISYGGSSSNCQVYRLIADMEQAILEMYTMAQLDEKDLGIVLNKPDDDETENEAEIQNDDLIGEFEDESKNTDNRG